MDTLYVFVKYNGTMRNLKVQDYKLEQHVSESYTGCSVYCLIILFLLNKFEVIKKLTSSKPYTNILQFRACSRDICPRQCRHK